MKLLRPLSVCRSRLGKNKYLHGGIALFLVLCLLPSVICAEDFSVCATAADMAPTATETEMPVMQSAGNAAMPAVVLPVLRSAVGHRLSVSICLQNNPGIAGLSLRLFFDTSVFSLVRDSTGKPFCTKELLSGGGTAVCSAKNDGCSVVWYDDEDCIGDGALVTLQFTVNADAATGEYPITVVSLDACNNDRVDQTFLSRDGLVQVYAASITNDLNGDNCIDVTDLQALYDYLASGAKPTRFAAESRYDIFVDLNADRTVDILDYQAYYEWYLTT